ncbi:MAG: hypothetical protein WCK84_09595 [Bacteroidota bacterium]
MNIAKQIGIIFLLIVFLFSTTGISILHHICNSSNNDTVTVYPEFFKISGCCCEADDTNNDTNDQEDLIDSYIPQNISAMPCCSNINFFLKLEVVTLSTEKLVINSFKILLPQYSLPLPVATTDEFISVSNYIFQFYSPPLFGKRLIHFLHQIKIPSFPALS